MMQPPAPQRAMVLAAGLGTRMRPLTLHRPKPLVEVAGKPLLSYVLAPLFAASLERIVINAHHLAAQIHDWVAALGSPHVVVSDESTLLLDSGGGIKKALPLLGPAPFYVLNADSFFLDTQTRNLDRMAQAWDPARMDCLLLLSTFEQATGFDGAGDFMMDTEGRLAFRGDHPQAPFIYAGCAILKPDLFKDQPEGPFSLSVVFRQAAARHRLFGLPLKGHWLHVGTVEAISAAEAVLQTHPDPHDRGG
jgi:MurNAc alpha-1-phosphate uridylyltransferase